MHRETPFQGVSPYAAIFGFYQFSTDPLAMFSIAPSRATVSI